MTRPHLSTQRPSPTTALYTVSTASPRHTFPVKTLHSFFLLVRLTVFILILFALVLRSLSSDRIPPSLSTLHASFQHTPWLHILPPAFVLLCLVFRRYHTEESLLTLRTLGIQTSTLSAWYLLPSSTRFIPTSQIRDIFIHEAFLGFEVRYYLAVVVEGEGEVVVVFPKLLPGRAVVEEVWRGARGCLYEPDEREKGRDGDGKG